MEIESRVIQSTLADGVEMRAFPGHFATNHSHVNFYVDLTDVKVHHKKAQQAAVGLAEYYSSTFIDTIICLEGTESIGAFMAAELSQSSVMVMNDDVDISIITPGVSTKKQFIFLDNMKSIIEGHSILLLLSWATTGKTVDRAMESVEYYGGHLMGICALFSIIPEVRGIPVHAAFTLEDIPDYISSPSSECGMCAQKRKLDAMINNMGYLKL